MANRILMKINENVPDNTCLYPAGNDKATNNTSCSCFGVAQNKCGIPEPTPSDDDDSSKLGLVLGLIFGILALIAIIVVIVICLKKKPAESIEQTYDHGSDDKKETLNTNQVAYDNEN